MKLLHRSILLLPLVASQLAACGGGGGAAPSPVPPQASAVTRPLVVLSTVVYQPLPTELYLGIGYYPIDSSLLATADGVPIDLAGLNVGDVVLMRGTETRYSDGRPTTIHVASVDVRQAVVGDVEIVDSAHARISVMGQAVILAPDTAIDGVTVAAGGLAALALGERVSVSGYRTTTGEIFATRVIHADAAAVLMLRGVVVGADSAHSRFSVGGLIVDYAGGGSALTGFPTGAPADGDSVLLFAAAAPSGGVLVPDHGGFAADDLAGASTDTLAYIAGVVSRFGSRSDFDVAGIHVSLTCTATTCGGDPAFLRADLDVQLSGQPDGHGALAASAFYPDAAHSPSHTITGPITAIDNSTGALTVMGFSALSDPTTVFGDIVGTARVAPLAAGALGVGDVVFVDGGYAGSTGTLLARAVTRQAGALPSLYTTNIQLSDPTIGYLGRTILTSANTHVDDCGQTKDTAYLFDPASGVWSLSATVADPTVNPMEALSVSVSTPVTGC